MLGTNEIEGRKAWLGAAVAIAALMLLPTVAEAQKFKQKACLECHQKLADKYAGLKYAHPAVKERKCEECHLRHGLVPKLLLKESGNSFCYKCHDKKTIGMDKPNVHKVLKTGSCLGCHDAHGSNAPHMLKAEGSETCFRCHKKEPFQRKVVHAALAMDGCRSCHVAHASDSKNLLKTDPGSLCAECHSATASGFQKAHGNYPVKGCTSCHDPHSSVQPKLLKASVHPPVAQGSCDACHAAPGSAKPFALLEESAKLCANCHDVAALDGGGKFQHAPVKNGECVTCHDPHASGNAKLTQAAGNELCATPGKQRSIPFLTRP
jgi:predicted CXXCH cytochrome family protein